MKTFHADQLVTVTIDGEALDGIVFEPQGLTKVMVAAYDGTFHTVHPKHVAERSDPGPDDDHLRDIVHRARTAGGRSAVGGGQGARGRAGFHAAAPHRPTGRGG